MKVWILYDYDGRVEGIYTEAGKEKKDQQVYEEAIMCRDNFIDRYHKEISELRELRQPYIADAEALLDTEREAKEKLLLVICKGIQNTHLKCDNPTRAVCEAAGDCIVCHAVANAIEEVIGL
jgi:hypothetical protein